DGAAWTLQSGTLNPDSIVYSFGVGTDISFDLSLIRQYGLTVHAFDPTSRSLAWIHGQKLPAGFLFHPVGLAGFDGVARFRPPDNPAFVSYSLTESNAAEQVVEAPVKRLSTLMRELGHDHIDLLKMDIEGAEYDALRDLLHQEAQVDQILVEFHHRFPSIGVEATKEALAMLNRHGYRIISISPTGEEYTFRKPDSPVPRAKCATPATPDP
ncbi:MAG TPA: FkbM family methyltransferase, partial [Rhodothermales bacterium]|nr:FkbM family methyltransferase [Rhodothermales bacterium]